MINIQILIIFSLVLLNSHVIGLSISPPETACQSSMRVDELESLMNSIYISSGNETIRMELPKDPSTETHYLSSEEETHVITLSYHDDTVYILSIVKKDDDDNDCNIDKERGISDELVISGYRAKHRCTTLEVLLKNFYMDGQEKLLLIS